MMNVEPSSSTSTSTSKTGKNMKPSTSTQSKSGMEPQTQMPCEVSSCLVEETCIIKAPIGTMWECLKEFNWAKCCPTSVKSCKFVTGNPLTIGSTYKLELHDGKTYTFMIVEISEIKRKFVMDMIECEPKENFTSMMSTVRLCKITDDNSTMMKWTTNYSNDVTPDNIRCRKDMMKSYFNDMRKFQNQ